MREQLNWLLEEKYNGTWTKRTDRDAVRLLQGEPLDYLIGWIPFLGCRIDLSKRPLIPRQETEYWTEKAINSIKQRGDSKDSVLSAMADKTERTRSRSLRVLDLFSGSGAIGVAILHHIPRAQVDFGEKDPNSYSQILKNIGVNRIIRTKGQKGRRKINTARVIKTDIFSNIKNTYDYILANPPYLARARKNRVAKSVQHYEPNMALWGGNDGLAIIKRFLKNAPAHLTPGGEVWMEFDSHQKPAIEKLLKQYSYQSFSFHKDQFGKWRYVIIKGFGG